MMEKKIKYRGANNYKYQLAEDYTILTDLHPKKMIMEPKKPVFICLDPDGFLTIKAGYAWDGPSGPTIDTKNFMRGSLVHDALYQLIREKRLPADTREYADELLGEICREDGMSAFRAWYVVRAVKLVGGIAIRFSKGEHKIHTAP
jgi:hypothetical protein